MQHLTVGDALGVPVQVGDTVRIIAWGGSVRLYDVGRTFVVLGVTAAGNLKHEHDVAGRRPVQPSMVAVARRDGLPGHEGNRVAS